MTIKSAILISKKRRRYLIKRTTSGAFSDFITSQKINILKEVKKKV